MGLSSLPLQEPPGILPPGPTLGTYPDNSLPFAATRASWLLRQISDASPEVGIGQGVSLPGLNQ